MPEYQVDHHDYGVRLYDVKRADFEIAGAALFIFHDGSAEWLPWVGIKSIKRKIGEPADA